MTVAHPEICNKGGGKVRDRVWGGGKAPENFRNL